MPKNWEAREAKQNKRRFGMKVSGKSIFLLQEMIGRRAREAKERKDKKALDK